jgi:rRNA-processing protein FCF1
MRTIVIDSGAFVAAERDDRLLATIIKAAMEENVSIVIPTAVIAEIWRTPPVDRAARFRNVASDLADLDVASADAIGALNGKAGASRIADGHVALLADAHKPSIVITSDETVIVRLLDTLGASHESWKNPSAMRENVDVEIVNV